MWQAVGEVAVDLLIPTGSGSDLERLFDKKNPNQLRVPLGYPGEFKRRLNRSGWFDEEVVAGGLLTQGKAMSLFSMMTGWALVELARARRSRSLPREFCVAVTPTRVIALAMSPWSEGSDDGGSDVVVKVKREEVGSWPRGSLRLDVDDRSSAGGTKGGLLHLGAEQFPVNWGNGTDTEELVELLARG